MAQMALNTTLSSFDDMPECPTQREDHPVDPDEELIADVVSNDVVEAVVNLAQRLSAEGVENKCVKAKIIIARKMDLFLNTNQFILDPTKGFGDDRPNIMDENLYHSITCWAQLPGCIGIDENGDIHFAARELSGKKTLWEECHWGLEAARRMDVIAVNVVDWDRIAICINGELQFMVSEELMG